MNNPVSYHRDGSVLVISVDNPPVNALSHAVRAGVVEALTMVGDATAVVLSCAGRTWFAGADISEFGKPPLSPSLPDMIAALEDCPVPVVAAIHGTALGGGMETALGCDFRVFDARAKCGFPEVDLGIFPGAGGTQRTPRLTGLGPAIEMCVTGKPINAQKAAKIGLADSIATEDVLASAIEFARSVTAKRRIRDMDNPEADETASETWRKFALTRRRGEHAPLLAIEAVEASVSMDIDAGLDKERDLFVGLITGQQSAAMRHLFFAERMAAKVNGLDAKPRPVKSVGVVGSGTMGGGIAMAFANAGIPVTLFDANADAHKAGLERIANLYTASAAKGRMSEAERDARIANITPASGYDGFAECDLVIEAVFERMDVKKAVFAELDAACRPDAILATNTSYLDVDEIAATVSDPSRVLGMHFFSPANVMRLLEIVRGAKTSGETLATALTVSKAIRKVGVVSGVCHGFIGNRMLKGYGREAGLLMIEGANPQDIDAALYAFGMPMGPMAMADMAGLDIGYDNRKSLVAGTDYEPLASAVQDRLVEMGRKGQKTGAGIYTYEAGSRAPVPDPEVDAMAEAIAKEHGITRREIGADEIVERCILALVNEGAMLLGEGIAQRGSDIDVVYANGYGFPRWRGGPMCYADSLGLDHVVERVRGYADGPNGKWWTPAPLLAQLASEGGRLSGWAAK